MQDTRPQYFRGMKAMGINSSHQNSADLYPTKIVACIAAWLWSKEKAID